MDYHYKFSSRRSIVEDLKDHLKSSEKQLFKDVLKQLQESTIDLGDSVCCTIHSGEVSVYAKIYSISKVGISGIISFDAYECDGEYIQCVELDDFMAGELNFLTELILQQVSDNKLHFKDGQD